MGFGSGILDFSAKDTWQTERKLVVGAHKKPELGQASPCHLGNYGSTKTYHFWDPESSTSGAWGVEHFDPDPVATTGMNTGGWTLHRAADRSLALQLILITPQPAWGRMVGKLPPF